LRFWTEFNLCTKNVFIKLSLDLSAFLFCFSAFFFFFFVAVNLCIMSTTCVSNSTDLFQSVIDILTASLYTWLRKRKLNLYDLVLNTDSISTVIGVYLSERNDSERRWIELHLMLNTDLVASVIDMTKSDRHCTRGSSICILWCWT
jgi:hypothetical protein